MVSFVVGVPMVGDVDDTSALGPRCHVGPADAGLTLIELVVSMSVMMAAMAIVTTGFVQIYRTTQYTDAATGADQELVLTFQRLDREIRYAHAIGPPATDGTSGDPYIRYRIKVAGLATCVELRLQQSSAQLRRRSWPEDDPTQATSEVPLASGIQTSTEPSGLASGMTVAPFTLLAADAAINYERLRITLASVPVGAATAASRQSTVTFTAQNTSLATDSTTVCTEDP